jgi:SlyX protein
MAQIDQCAARNDALPAYPGVPNLEDQLIELQTRVAFQEDALLELTKTVADQQREILEFKKDLEQLQSQLRNLTSEEVMSPSDEPPPPHY